MNKPINGTSALAQADASSAVKPDMKTTAHGVWQMKLFPPNIINVYLMEDVLIDAATRWDASSLLKQLANVSISQVALTHCHPDHQGSVKRICEKGKLVIRQRSCSIRPITAREFERETWKEALFVARQEPDH